jgi:NADPH-dependent curcumin reductase CurA
MKVTISCTCSDYNSVGNEWDTYFKVSGSSVHSGSLVKVTRNGSLSVYTKIIEYDSVMDVGSEFYKFTVTKNDFAYGFVVTQTIYVRENRGRYTGNVATWKVRYKFESLD